MTIYTQYLADIEDILAIRLTCSECLGSVAIPVAQHKRVQGKCPNCHKDWFLEDSVELGTIETFLKDCAALGKRKPTARCQIQLELNANGLKTAPKDGSA